MRPTLTVAAFALALAACSGGTELTDDTDGDTASAPTSAERLGVPEEFRLLWSTEEGCTTSDGGAGTQIYWHTDDAESYEEGGRTFIRATETWYWFHGGSGTADCKDEWEITGEFIISDYERFGCATCEEIFYFTRTLKDQGCQYGYHQLYGYGDDDAPPEEPIYNGYLMFDTHIEFDDSPNEDNKMLVFARYVTPSGSVFNNNYSVPNMSRRDADDPESIGPPGSYTWVGESCVGSSDGGGGGV